MEFLGTNAFKSNPKDKIREAAIKQRKKHTWYPANSTTKMLEGRPDPDYLIDWKGISAPSFHTSIQKITTDFNSGNLKEFWNGVQKFTQVAEAGNIVRSLIVGGQIISEESRVHKMMRDYFQTLTQNPVDFAVLKSIAGTGI